MVDITATPSPGYVFDHWEGSLGGNVNPAEILVASPKRVTAVFLPAFVLAADASPQDGGMVMINPVEPANGYAVGTVVTLSANASAGYVFDHWEGDLSGNSSPAQLLISENQTVTAVFIPVFRLTIGVGSGGGGTVTLDPPQPTGGYPSGTTVLVLARAEVGYRFDHWEGSLSGSSGLVTVVMDAPKQIVAAFKKSPSSHWWWIAIGSGILALAAGASGLAWWQRKQRHAS